MLKLAVMSHRNLDKEENGLPSEVVKAEVVDMPMVMRR